MKLARLNHILIPATLEARERWRRRPILRLARPAVWIYEALSAEGRVLTVLTLFVGTAGLEIGRTQVYMLWALLTAALVASLALRRIFALRGVGLDVRAPARVSVGEPMLLTLSLTNPGSVPHHAIRIHGPFLPWDGAWLGPLPSVAELPADGKHRCVVRARFIERGRHHIEPFEATALVPLGMAQGPRIRSSGCRFTVVPRLAPVASVELPIGHSYQPGGVASASRIGEARELFGVRPYRPGDPVRDLHPKTWARTGTPHVREYQQEYFSRIGVIVDTDKTQVTEDGFEAALSLAAGVVARLTGGEALIDLLVLGGEIHSFTIGRSLGTLDQALEILAHAQPTDGLTPAELMTRLEPLLSRVSCMLVITQSTDPSRLVLGEALRERRIATRMFRVHDDTGFAWLAKRRPLLPPRSSDERVIHATAIAGEEPFVL